MSYTKLMNKEMTDLEYLHWLHDQMAIAASGMEAQIRVQKEMATVFCNEKNTDYYIESIESANTYLKDQLYKGINLLNIEIELEKVSPRNMEMGQRLLILFYSDDPNIYKKS